MDSQKVLKTAFVTVVLVCVLCSAARGQYCSASGGGEQYVSGVVVGTLANTGTGSDGYVDYTNMSITMEWGESQVATIINGLSVAGSQCGIWVDWNADGDFDDGGETIAMSGGPALFTGTVTVPGATTVGDKRMRIRIMGDGSLTACGDTTYGEVEDYTIGVVIPWTGSGDANDPFQIWTAADMQAIGAGSGYWGSHFKLMADVDLSAYTGTSFNIIGNDVNAFAGVFDGNGHTISNFTYSGAGTDLIGLFRSLQGPGAEIKDLVLLNPVVTGHYHVGSLVGQTGGEASISNCYVEGGSVSGNMFVGRLVGRNLGAMSNCSSAGNVSASGDDSGRVGGLVGQNYGTISDCHSEGDVSGQGYVGGLVGSDHGGIVTNCYTTGSVSAGGWDHDVGGLVGSGSGSTITNCWSSANVTSTGSYSICIGGLVGSGGATNCYATGNVSGNPSWGSAVGGLVGSGGATNCYATGSVSAS
ncbi:MAG: hypothetical protein JSW23_04040, partial [Planctomycetota bacterium]